MLRSVKSASFRSLQIKKFNISKGVAKFSLLGVVALWGDCTFILAGWGHMILADLCYVALFEDFSLERIIKSVEVFAFSC